MFKCFHASCESGTQSEKGAWDELGFLVWQNKLSGEKPRSDAWVIHMKMAGLWEDRERISSFPGANSRKLAAPKPPADVDLPPEASDEEQAAVNLKALEPDRSKVPDNVVAFPQACETGTSWENVPRGTTEEGPSDEDLLAAAQFGELEPVESFDAVAPEGGEAGEPAIRGAGEGESGGDEPPEGGGGELPPEPPPENLPLKALRRFYEQLTLSPEDEELLWRKRGLPREAVLAYGFKSSPRSNEAILLALKDEFPLSALLESGLFNLAKKTGEPRPERQLFGYGTTGRKKKLNSGKEVLEMEWNHPILIPYLDEEGEVIGLRPHKGGIPGQPARLFVARYVKGSPLRTAEEPGRRGVSFTEGEYKACGVHWAMGGKIGSAAIPGISMSRNEPIWEAIVAWVGLVRAEKAWTVFDLEVKDDPSLPGFKADPAKRIAAHVYGRYLGIILGGITIPGTKGKRIDSRVGLLPASWLVNGKADWDGGLVKLVTEFAPVLQGDSDAVWAKVSSKVQRVFRDVLDLARPANELRHAGLLDDKVEQLIQAGLERLFYKPNIPVGDWRTEKVAAKIRSLIEERRPAADKDKGRRWGETKQFEELAEAYDSVKGVFFRYKEPDAKSRPGIFKSIREAVADKDEDGKSRVPDEEGAELFRIKLKGIPTVVSNFRMEQFYTLSLAGDDTVRMVQMWNKEGETTGEVELPSDRYATAAKFREWLDKQGGYVWHAGQTELDLMKEDLAHYAAYRGVRQVPAYGEHVETGLWFFKDVAIGGDGRQVLPDESGIFWNESQGYKILESGKDKQEFRQPAPLMHPGTGIGQNERGEFVPVPMAQAQPVSALFQICAANFRDVVGGYDGWMSFGMFLSYAAAPEMFKTYKCFAGLFAHGEAAQGKTTLLQWLMEIWGFHGMGAGIGLRSKNATAVGLQIVLEQFSNLPVWLDEFRSYECAEDKVGILHAGFNRELPSKFASDGVMRRIRTAPAVSGETTLANDAAGRSRYAHVLVASSKRTRNCYDEMQELRPFFFVIGRELLLNRDRFVERFMVHFKEWLVRPSMRALDDRARKVHGQAYAALRAASEVLSSGGAPVLQAAEVEDFGKWMEVYAREAVNAVADQINVNQFLEHIITAVGSGVFGDRAEDIKRYFGVAKTEMSRPPGVDSDVQENWWSYRIYIEPNGTMAELARWLNLQRKTLKLDKGDMRDQLKNRAFWSPLNGPNGCQFRFKNGKARCWVLEVDQLPDGLGYRQVTDEAYKKVRFSGPGGCYVGNTDPKWMDPRKGDIYALIERIEKQEGGAA